ncbi:MAG: anaerobic sulfatase maturase [Moritella sp.]|uniref:anaerobic sulfatase maturase n=1 Tax=Moritella sp. TaxID=78556 RepID=UPI0029BB52DB|nr:anaerobic sulfatase maturase [Moritella sp.]MDX2321958.1 anaerobic sulfatase maturase [Moritella sp.]
MTELSLPYSLFIKAESAKCNLDCSYCYYLANETAKLESMSETLMASIVKNHIGSQPNQFKQADFVWHGGEPMLRGLDFYQQAVTQQNLVKGDNTIRNTLQTHGTLINERWAKFFSENNFMLGISIDGPNLLNDIARIDKNGKSSFERTMRGIHHLNKHNVEFNTLTVVNNRTYKHGKQIYTFLKDNGSGYMQFQPCIDYALDRRSDYDWSLEGKQWGEFLCAVFDEWSNHDVGEVYVQFFENCLMILMGQQSQMCHHSDTCGQQLMVESTGETYSCDHYGYDEYQLGNAKQDSFAVLVNSQVQRQFGEDKFNDLNDKCRRCDFLPMCNGGCPKNRIDKTLNGQNLNLLCEGYETFFRHALPKLLKMTDAMKQGYSPRYFSVF